MRINVLARASDHLGDAKGKQSVNDAMLNEQSKEWWAWEPLPDRPPAITTIRAEDRPKERPASALHTRGNQRPVSRASAGSEWSGRLRRSEPSRPPQPDLAQFRRSLRLLGLRPQDLGLPPSPSHDRPRNPARHAQPKIHTRLERRTVSEDDLRHLLDEPFFTDDSKRGVVSQAVYEEWYFKKLDSIKKRKEQETQHEKLKSWENQNSKCEKIIKSKERYDEWLQKKITKKQQSEDKTSSTKANRRPGIGRRSMSNPEQSEAAFKEWKQKKDQEFLKKKEEEKRKARLEEQAQKRLDAEKAFQYWKTKKDDELKRLAKEKEEAEQIKLEEKEREKSQKEKDSNVCFRLWKDRKDKIAHEKIEKIREKETKQQEEKEKRERERKEEAAAAYASWQESLRKRKSPIRPPG